MHLTNLEQLFELIPGGAKRHLVVVWAMDPHTIGSVAKAVEMGFLDATLLGESNIIIDLCRGLNINPEIFTLIDQKTPDSAAYKAVELINQGKGDLLMKGNISSDRYLKAILNKELGVVDRGSVLSHVTVLKMASYHKLLIIGDIAIIPLPDLKQKIAITNYLVKTAQAIGIEQPKVSILAATEQVLPGLVACTDAAIISKMADRQQIDGAIIDGPLSFDLSVNKNSVSIKGVKSRVAGDADCLLFPNLESGNIFYKTLSQEGNSDMAAIIVGARVPIVLSSRGDSTQTKLYSLALAAAMHNRI